MIAAECMKFSDEFIPELVETLASEMNPNTVCSVAGKKIYSCGYNIYNHIIY